MKYTTVIIIDTQRWKVAGLFDGIDHMYQWQEGLESHRVISGSRETEGCRTELVYGTSRGKLVMTETVTRRKLPEEYHTVYKSKGVTNKSYNYFHEESDGKTRWEMVNVFRFSGIMSLMSPFLKSAFRKNTLLNMERFRDYAEKKHPPKQILK